MAQNIIGINMTIPQENIINENNNEENDLIKIDIDLKDIKEINERNKNLINKKRKREENDPFLLKQKEIYFINLIHYYFKYIYYLVNENNKNDKNNNEINNEKKLLIKIFDYLCNFETDQTLDLIKNTNLYKMTNYFKIFFMFKDDILYQKANNLLNHFKNMFKKSLESI